MSLALLLLSFLPLRAQEKAQEAYRKEKMNIMGTSFSGFSMPVPYGQERSKDYLIAYLKNEGKISEKRNYIEIRESYWRKKDEPSLVYAQVIGDQSASRIWIGYSHEASNDFIAALESQMESLSFILHKQHLQSQIKEAEAAATFLSKELKQAQRQEERLLRQQEKNNQEKIKLEKALEQSLLEKDRLEAEISGNAQAQEEKAHSLEEVKKQLGYLKEKLQRL